MPTYEYACKKCGEHLEVVQSFKDDALTTCPACGGALRKVFGNVGIVFKGSGFYKTDSRPAAKSDSKSVAASDSGDGKDGKKDKASDKAEKKSSDTSATSSSAGSSAAAAS